MTLYVGLDVSLDQTAICIVDAAGKIYREGKAESGPNAISTWLVSWTGSYERVGLEAGPLSPWFCEGLLAAGVPAVCS